MKNGKCFVMYILSQFQKKRENHVHQLEQTVSANSVLARPTQSLGEHLVRNSPAGALVALAESPACRNPQSIVHLQGEGLRQASSCPKGSASTQERQRGLPNSLSCTLSDTQGSGGSCLRKLGSPIGTGPQERVCLLWGSGPQSRQAICFHLS